MFLYQNLSTDFVLVDADWPLKKGLKLVQNLQPPRVIVRRRHKDGQEYFYLFDFRKFETLVRDKNPQDPLQAALVWKESDAVEILPDTLSTADAPPRGVVMSEGRLLGFWERPKGGAYKGGTAFRAGTTLVQRFLLAKFPKTVPLHEERTLMVTLAVTERGISLRLPAGAKVDVKVEVKKGFEIIGPDRGQLLVQDGTSSLPFRLKATTLGTGEIRVWVSLKGMDLAGLNITPQVEAGPASEEKIIEGREPISEPKSRHPDLFLTILEQRVNGKRGFSMEIFGPEHRIYGEKYDFIPFQQDPGEYFEAFYQDIESLLKESVQNPTQTMMKMADKGNLLCEMLLPRDLREHLWSLRKNIASIFIQSDEPWIPWELCRLSGEVNGRIEEGDFWCEAFDLTRWVRAIDRHAIKVSEDLSLNRMAVVVPNNSGLAYAAKEKEYLLSLCTGTRTVKEIEARFQKLKLTLASGAYDGWHFSGHGMFCHPNPDHAVIQLEDEPLKPENLGGMVQNLGRSSKPLVFLNACQIGQGGMSLTGLGGWAYRFLTAGAGAFIGPLWSVCDQSAYTFAKTLYSELLKGITMGRAVRTARLKIKAAEDLTWLAYTVFGYPMAIVKP
jgi:hypothetical protein